MLSFLYKLGYLFLTAVFLLIFSAFVFYALDSFMSNIANSPLTAKELLIPTVVFSSLFIALSSYLENVKNTRDTVVWKQKEKTLSLLEPYESNLEVFHDLKSEQDIDLGMHSLILSMQASQGTKIKYEDVKQIF